MHLTKIEVKNFRLLHDITISLEKQTTVIVGRNNCGKTSLTEIMKRLLSGNNLSFWLEDFSFCAHKNFWDAFVAASSGMKEQDIRKILPAIEIQFHFSYEKIRLSACSATSSLISILIAPRLS